MSVVWSAATQDAKANGSRFERGAVSLAHPCAPRHKYILYKKPNEIKLEYIPGDVTQSN